MQVKSKSNSAVDGTSTAPAWKLHLFAVIPMEFELIRTGYIESWSIKYINVSIHRHQEIIVTELERQNFNEDSTSNKNTATQANVTSDLIRPLPVQSHFECSKSDRQVGLADRDRGSNGEFSDASSLSEYWCFEELTNPSRSGNSEIKHKIQSKHHHRVIQS
jgi:hypothetical protein